MVLKHPMAGGEYVRDRHGVIWRIVRDGGMVTTADDTGITSAGIEWARTTYGPLTPVADVSGAALASPDRTGDTGDTP